MLLPPRSKRSRRAESPMSVRRRCSTCVFLCSPSCAKAGQGGWCGGDPGGGLGTSVEAIMAAIERAWSERGVAILVDLGGAETNSEMAIEMLPESRRARVVVCNAPVVEGAVMAATEAASGASLEAGGRTAQETTPA